MRHRIAARREPEADAGPDTAAGAKRAAETDRDPVRLLHAITGTGVGGAQSMLAKLLEAGEGVFDGYAQSILSLMPPGELSGRFIRAGAPVHTLKMRSGMPTPLALARLCLRARAARPELIVGWMHHAGLAAYAAAGLLRPRRPVIWNIRHSLEDMAREKPSTRMALRATIGLSDRIDAHIFNSHVAKAQYAALGYDVGRSVVIPNGFDCGQFRPREDARRKLAEIFHVDVARPIVGMVARNHPMKDPVTLIRACSGLWDAGHDFSLLIAGPGMEALEGNPVMAGLPTGARARIRLAAGRFDVAEWLPGLDLFVLPSAWGEAFPNILGEAMASGVPCVATDVGDARWIVGDHGRIVPPGTPEAMCAAMAALLSLAPEERRLLGARARERVIAHFALSAVARDYARLYESVLDRWHSRRPAGQAG